jgi:hypothetical protein
MELRCRRPLMLASVVVVAALSLLAAGCGGGGSSGVASVASSSTAATTGGQDSLVPYSDCMRANGVLNFPDPDSSGEIPKEAAVSAFQGE